MGSFPERFARPAGAAGAGAGPPNFGGEGGVTSLGSEDAAGGDGEDGDSGSGGAEGGAAAGAAIGLGAAGLGGVGGGGGMLTGVGEFPKGWGYKPRISPLKICSTISRARFGVQSIFDTHLFAPASNASLIMSVR